MSAKCPKCGADISDTFAAADPSVGLDSGGWVLRCLRSRRGRMGNTFDLTKAGVPVKILMFGGVDQASIKNLLTEPLKRGGGHDLSGVVDFKIDEVDDDGGGQKH